MKIPQTHVRNGALEVKTALKFLAGLGCSQELLQTLDGSNTAREIYGRLVEQGAEQVILRVCEAARDYCREVSGIDVTVYLVDASSRIVVMTDREVC